MHVYLRIVCVFVIIVNVCVFLIPTFAKRQKGRVDIFIRHPFRRVLVFASKFKRASARSTCHPSISSVGCKLNFRCTISCQQLSGWFYEIRTFLAFIFVCNLCILFGINFRIALVLWLRSFCVLFCPKLFDICKYVCCVIYLYLLSPWFSRIIIFSSTISMINL